MSPKPKLKITMTESDAQDILNDVIVEWSWTTDTGLDIDLEIGLGRCCSQCDKETLVTELKELKDGSELCPNCHKNKLTPCYCTETDLSVPHYQEDH